MFFTLEFCHRLAYKIGTRLDNIEQNFFRLRTEVPVYTSQKYYCEIIYFCGSKKKYYFG